MALIICPECGKNISDKALFCIHCGFPIQKENATKEQYCPYCGEKIPIESLFCAYCGRSVRVDGGIEEQKRTKKMSSSDLNVMEYKQELDLPHDLVQIQRNQLIEQRKQLAEQREQYESVAKCPKCGSISLSVEKQGFGVGKAIAGAVLFGGVGVLAGGVGANKPVVTCINCGYKFKI